MTITLPTQETSLAEDAEHSREAGIMVTLYRRGYQPLMIFLPTQDYDWTTPRIYRDVVPAILTDVPDAIEELVIARGPQPLA